jgi:antitoxin component YwqK of YwqJK toxin-antitoxin module
MFREDNFTYRGELLNGVPHGHGSLIKGGNQELYVGVFADGKLNGPVNIYTD